MSVWPTIEQYIAQHGAAALVTLAEARGSSPREAGARMVVRPDGIFAGTIGGGALEWAALAEAQALLARPGGNSVRRFTKALGPDLGQCCGGQVTIVIERFEAADLAVVAGLAAAERVGPLLTVASPDRLRRVTRRVLGPDERPAVSAQSSYAELADGRILERFGDAGTPLYLFGAGHVGRALVVAVAPLPFVVTWIDPRPAPFPPDVPDNVRCAVEADPVRLIATAPADALIAIMTHSHALDLDLVIAALKAGRFAYVGLIGSATKRARFVSAMQRIGIASRALARLKCPIGLADIRDKTPAVIAASIVAELLIMRGAARAAQPLPGSIPLGQDLPRGTGHG